MYTFFSLADSASGQWLLDHTGTILIVIVAALTFAFGLVDLIRFSPRRTWAISSVCFAESIRRRVLWITPLAILGVMIVAQLQRPLDEQDAIRETTKFCLFATGMVVVIVAILLACTSLPKEIDNRVIFTIVTKPTTRLEIVLGKTIGFARVSAVILLIMGVFTFTYLHFRAWSLQRQLAARLDSGMIESPQRPTLQHYREAGLINAKTLAETDDLQFYPQLPAVNQIRRFATATGDYQMLIPFDLSPDWFAAKNDPSFRIGIRCTVGYSANPNAPKESSATEPTSRPLPLLPSTQPAPEPSVLIAVLDSDQTVLVDSNVLSGGKAIPIPRSGDTSIPIILPPDAISKLATTAEARDPSARRIYVSIVGTDPNFLYNLGARPCYMSAMVIKSDGTIDQKPLLPPPDPNRNNEPMLPIFHGAYSRYGQALRGSEKPGPVAIYHFRNAEPKDGQQNVDFETVMGIERTGADDDEQVLTDVQITVRNTASGQVTAPITLHPETNLSSYFQFPATAVAGGEFDVIVRCLNSQRSVGLRPTGVNMVISTGSFAFNLIKSLLIFWLLTVLVVAVAIFCSTFLSWPIAVVLCVLVLLGHWGVDQLGDSTKPGIGAQVATDFGFREPETVRVISGSVETLTRIMNVVSKVLPDISQFPALEDIERGVSIPHDKLLDALTEAAAYGIPLILMGYVFFKNKEVAP